jgi:plasmid stability protein
MAQIIIRNIPEAIMAEFRKLANRRDSSMESEVRGLIRGAVEEDRKARRFAAASRRRLAKFRAESRVFEDSVALIREDRDR